jgi:phosphoserine phosphatase
VARRTATHPRWHRPYTDLVYQPMLEVLQYLRANGFKTYIVTGGGQDFVRTTRGGLRHPSRTGHRLRGRDEVQATTSRTGRFS